MVLVGSVFPSRPVPLTLDQVVRRNLRLIGIHNYAPKHLQVAVRFLSEQRQYPFESLVSHWLPLSEAERAFQMAREPGVLRVGIRPATE
jgi:threonine dehydrogenase-like Zn-dependent dehydrogenase